MKKKELNTGMRNGDLFCFNCGTSQKIPLPMPVTMAADFMKSFGKHHKNCAKTWTEPINNTPTEKTEKENALWWLENGEQGLSSKTMFKYLCDDYPINAPREYEPSDPDDFRRCYLLLKAVPQFKQKLGRMKPISNYWSNLVDNWDKLELMLIEQMETKKSNGMYQFMNTLKN